MEPLPNLAVPVAGFAPEPAGPAAAPVRATPVTPAAPTPPAAQIAPALLSLGQAADGSQQMTLRLHPAELGVVQVQIGRTATGSAHVEITVEKTATLQALLEDQPQLHRALDDAGVPAAGRTVTFHTAPPPSMAAGGNGSSLLAPNQGNAFGSSGNGLSGGGKSSNTSNEPGYDLGSRRQSQPSENRSRPIGATSYRIGIDIIA
jgi:flagellar hook-length control protein FliK